MEELWSKFVVKLGQNSPFYACLALFAKLIPTSDIEIAMTSGDELKVNPFFLKGLKDKEAFSFFLHQVLHLALQHNRRGVGRDAEVWNVAADIVVNQIISESTSWPPAPKTASNHRFKDCTVEEVYRRLMEEEVPSGPLSSGDDPTDDAIIDDDDDGSQDQQSGDSADNEDSRAAPSPDADDSVPDSTGDAANDGGKPTISKRYDAHGDLCVSKPSGNSNTSSDSSSNSNTPGCGLSEDLFWDEAILQAEFATSSKGRGELPLGWQREYARVQKSRIDWRKELWRFVSNRQSDFTEFDLRHVHRGLYLEELCVESLTMAVAIDTSGSICHTELGIFMRELEDIQGLYKDIEISLYYCDAEVDGPHLFKGRRNVTHDRSTSGPVGGGGTSFEPVFNEIESLPLAGRPNCLVYFTDGDGDCPRQAPGYPTLWVLTEDGVEESSLPFGHKIRLSAAA